MEIKSVKLELNKGYYVNITMHENSSTRLYVLYDKNDTKKVESFNRDSFLLKANQYVKLTNMQECIIASH